MIPKFTPPPSSPRAASDGSGTNKLNQHREVEMFRHHTTEKVKHEATKNGCGSMHPLSNTSKIFVRYAAETKHPVVDLGCAFGVAAIEAAKTSGGQVIGCDVAAEHLHILQERASVLGLASKITVKLGKFPEEISFADNTVGATLASLVLPYLTIEELDHGLQKIFAWLVPGGKLLISSYTIHIKEFSNPQFQAEYQKRVSSGLKWPGYFEDFNEFSTMAEENRTTNSVPARLHFFDTAPLVKALMDIGFEIEIAQYVDGKTNGAVEETFHDGREMLSIVARKPIRSE